MKQTNDQPQTLLEAIRYFSDIDRCIDFMAHFRWAGGKAVCPRCSCPETYYLAKRRVWKCKGCYKQFSIKVGTIMEDSAIPLDKWLSAMWMIVNAKNGISSYEIQRAVGVAQKSAWFLLHRIRLAMQQGTFEKLGGDSGHVEVDETFIGGKARNMHIAQRKRRITGTGGKDKTAVMGILERGGEVRTMVIGTRKKSELHANVRKHVEAGSALYSDELRSYNGLEGDYAHQVINHAVKYVDGQVHTNGIENFWSLLKRCIKGTYVSIEPFHLFRYLDEETYRYNMRKMNDAQRFVLALQSIVGKRLTYKAVTGKDIKEARQNIPTV
ncbi:MAG: IS1595 family transposase [Acidobacteriota bacterium]